MEPKYVPFKELLTGHLFRIPAYQRAYSWGTPQRKDLFQDIEKLYSSTGDDVDHKTHFMATIVCHDINKKKSFGPETYKVFNVVDGQQRITTLIILLKAIEKKMSLENEQYYTKSINKIKDLLVKDDTHELVLIQTMHSSAIVLREYLISGKIPRSSNIDTLATKALVGGFNDCENFINEWLETKTLNSLLLILMNNLFFILHVLRDESSVYTVFEVLNSRGLAVDWLDKCKSMLMGVTFEILEDKEAILNSKIEDLQKYWTNIYKEIGILEIDGSEIVRFAAALHTTQNLSKVMDVQSAMIYFKELCYENVENALEISSWLQDVTSVLRELKMDSMRAPVLEIRHARLLAVAIKLSAFVSPEQEKELFDLWEKTTFIIFGLHRKDSRNNIGDYVKLSTKIMGHNANVTKYSNERFVETKEGLMKLARQYPMKHIKQIFENEDSYKSWSEELRYFMYHYEMDCAKKNNMHFSDKAWSEIWNNSLNKSIEHIFPQSESPYWKGVIHKNHDYYRHTLGNLLVLPQSINSSMGAREYKYKKEIYKNSDVIAAKTLAHTYSSWDSNSIRHRTKELIEWAQDYWQI